MSETIREIFPVVDFTSESTARGTSNKISFSWSSYTSSNVHGQTRCVFSAPLEAIVEWASQNSLADEFHIKASEWKDGTMMLSSPSLWYLHPSYQRIIFMGKSAPKTVLPLIFKELMDDPDYWFSALRTITGNDAAKGIKDFELAKNAWVDWGRKNGYIT